ncbi:DUF3108 domain-containing protein [Microbulbifer sp.]|uniref:DUF3108 domain-containing protein n=1 Tax=Microbulbifer sp. TaxID=1908541 RepID=UPI00258EB834|nr:DUF3108 domain-containing protein [Microbulbifer sp.]
MSRITATNHIAATVRTALAFLILLPFSVGAEPSSDSTSSILQPFTATYEAKFGGFGVTAVRTLSGGPDSWRLDFSANSLFAKIEEYSRFSRQGTQLLPQHYNYKKTGLGRDRHTAFNFDHAKHRITNIYDKERSINDAPKDIQDKISYQLQLAQDVAAGKKNLEYRVANGKKIRHYKFRILGNESIKTPMGMVETVRVQRVREEDAERETDIWFAPEWNYALVKLSQQEEDGKSYQITLTKLTIDGAPVNIKK